MSDMDVFRAGRVRRWHSNPDLAHTDDRIDGHSGRVARIILQYHPDPTVALLRAALTHDDGEHAVGDVKAPAKDAHPELSAWLDQAERSARIDLWGREPELTDVDRRWLRFADRLDAYMWTEFHAPHVLDGDGWPEALAWIQFEAQLLRAEFEGAA